MLRRLRVLPRRLQREFPNVDTFCTLSPIPGFRPWLVQRLRQRQCMRDSEIELTPFRPSLEAALVLFKERLLQDTQVANPRLPPEEASSEDFLLWFLDHNSTSRTWLRHRPPALQEALSMLLMQFCSHYVCRERRQGRAVDPVAK